MCESTYVCMCDDIQEISNNVNEAVNKSAQNTQKTHSNSHTRMSVCVCVCGFVISAQLINKID